MRQHRNWAIGRFSAGHYIAKEETAAMMLQRLFWFSMIVLISMVIISSSYCQNTLIPVDTSGIDHLISGTDCPLMIIASAAWCAPCREELPVLNRLYLKYKDRGIRISVLSLDVSQGAMQRIVDQMNLQFPIYWGGDAMAMHYNIFGMPTILLVRDGKVEKRIVGKRTEDFLEKTITDLVESCNR